MNTGLTYPGGAEELIRLWNRRRGMLALAEGESLGGGAPDLADLATRPAPIPGALPAGVSAHRRKCHEVQTDLAGYSELAILNGLTIAHLRKRRFPREAPVLFQRIWAEQGAALIAELPMRWLISSAMTFGEHGANRVQRALGGQLNILFSLMKLYEFERLFSGLSPTEPFPLKNRQKADLPLGMPPYSLTSGGLDVNLLAPLFEAAGQEPVLGPLARRLLDALNADPGTLFRRLSITRGTLKDRREKRRNADNSERNGAD